MTTHAPTEPATESWLPAADDTDGREARRTDRTDSKGWVKVRSRWHRLVNDGLTWIGVVVAAVGFVLLFVAWGRVAGETQVYRQLPYIVSAGFTGLALVMVGLTVIVVAVQRRDDAAQRRLTERMVALLNEINGDDTNTNT